LTRKSAGYEHSLGKLSPTGTRSRRPPRCRVSHLDLRGLRVGVTLSGGNVGSERFAALVARQSLGFAGRCPGRLGPM